MEKRPSQTLSEMDIKPKVTLSITKEAVTPRIGADSNSDPNSTSSNNPTSQVTQSAARKYNPEDDRSILNQGPEIRIGTQTSVFDIHHSSTMIKQLHFCLSMDKTDWNCELQLGASVSNPKTS